MVDVVFLTCQRANLKFFKCFRGFKPVQISGMMVTNCVVLLPYTTKLSFLFCFVFRCCCFSKNLKKKSYVYKIISSYGSFTAPQLKYFGPDNRNLQNLKERGEKRKSIDFNYDVNLTFSHNPNRANLRSNFQKFACGELKGILSVGIQTGIPENGYSNLF